MQFYKFNVYQRIKYFNYYDLNNSKGIIFRKYIINIANIIISYKISKNNSK